MSKLVKFFAIVVLLAGAIAVTPGIAEARGGHGHGGSHHGGGWRGGGAYFYGGPYYYAPACGWVRVRVWRNGYWVVRRAWRCW